MLTACAEDDPQQFIKEGQALFEKGDLKEAGVQFKNALQLNPQLAEAYYGLALLSEKTNDLRSMAQNLLETVRLAPENVEAQVKLGFLVIDNLDKAKEYLAIALKLEPENINVMLLDGRIRLLEKDYKGVISQVDRVQVKEPLNEGALWLQSKVYIEEKQYEKALVLLNEGLAAYPDNMEFGMLKVRLYKEKRNFDGISRTYEQLVALHPEDKKLRYAQLEVLARTAKDAEVVEKSLRNAIAADENDLTLKLTLIDMLERRDIDQAEKQLKQFIQTSPDNMDLKGRLAGFYMGHKKNLLAQNLLKQVAEQDSNGKNGLVAKVRLAELALVQKNKELAEKLLSEVLLVDNANSNALLLRANLRLAAKDSDGVISDLRIVLRDKPDSVEGMVVMAKAYVLKGEQEVAESFLHKALEVNPANINAIIPLVAARTERGDSERAEDLLVKAIKVDSTNSALTEMLVRVRVIEKDWVGAQFAIDELKKQLKDHFPAQMLTGMLLGFQGKHGEAIGIYKDILIEKPEMNAALLAIKDSYHSAKQPKEYIVFLKGYLESNPHSIPAVDLLAKKYIEEKKWAESEKVLRRIITLEPKSILGYRLLGAVLLAQGKTIDALKVYQNGLTAMPDNPSLMLALAKYYKEVKAYDKSIASYEKLLKIFPKADEAANDLADLLVSISDDPVNLNRAKQLVERFKNSQQPYALDTYGWVMFKVGELDKAVIALRQSAKAVPSNMDIRYHLGEVLYAKADYLESKKELQAAIALSKKQGAFIGSERAQQLLKKIDKQS